jgi:EAL domain-containing protein (putative c-di-GMP-specific phosphodiesterase class I)
MLSVNLSGHSVGDPAFHVWACGKLDEAGPALCSRLCFEITETAGVANLAQAAAFIAELRSRGVRVALDDFGSGTASFGYLKKLSVDFLKIDGQFVRDMLTDALNEAAVRCFVDVAKVVGMKTIAEFVESPAVMSRLERMGVDYAQGFLVHQPEPIDGLLDDLPDAASRAPSQSLHGLSICS